MRFTVLGSGTSQPDPDRGPAGFAVTTAAGSWWVDGGSGTLQRSMRAGIDPLTLRGGVYSHHHPDHAADLVPLLFARRVAGTATPYPIHAGVGFAALLDRLRHAWGHWIDVPVEVHELPLDRDSDVQLDDLRLRTAPAIHSAGALHLRFEADGAAVVFSGDTGPSPALTRLARGADLLVCECAGSDADPIPGHLTPRDVAAVVDAARPAAVWLTHLYPQVDPDLAVATVARTGVPTRRADDGDVWSSPRQRAVSAATAPPGPR